MTPSEAVQQAATGKLLAVYVVLGEEPILRDEVLGALRSAALAGGVAAFNEDKFTAGEADIDRIISACRTVPMMAPRRFVLVRAAERWDTEGDSAQLDRLAEYAAAPVDSTCLVIVASKLDGRRRFSQATRKGGYGVACDPLDPRAVPRWIVARFAAKGHAVEPEIAEHLATLAGPQLSPLGDAIERLSLYAGPGAPITGDAVAACIARVSTADTWALVDAVGARDLGKALRTLSDAYDPRDRGLPLLGALAWSVRQLARYLAATESGLSPDEAARRAGVFQPHRARELGAKAAALRASQNGRGAREAERWLLILAETDVALKSSRRPADSILEDMLTRLCRSEARAARPAPRHEGRPV